MTILYQGIRYLIIKSGVISIKLSQWLCHREDIVPEHILLILRPLQDSVFSIREVLLEHPKIGKIRINYRNVIGCGSISQVHSIPNSDEIIKVHRVSSINTELNIWKYILLACEKMIQKRIPLDINGFVDKIKEQWDYKAEFNNYIQIKKSVEDLKWVKVPEVIEASEEFMIMERIKGYTYQEITQEYPEYIRDLSEKILITYIWMIYKGKVHVDLHDGNYKCVINDDDTIELVIYDFGLCIQLDCVEDSNVILELWESFSELNTAKIHSILYKLLVMPVKSINDLNPFRRISSNLSFVTWIEGLLSDIAETGNIVRIDYMCILSGLVLLARSFIYVDSTGAQIPFDPFGSSLDSMKRHVNPEVRKLGEKFNADLETFFKNTETKEFVNNKKIVCHK